MSTLTRTPRGADTSDSSIKWLVKSGKHHFRAFQTQRQHADLITRVVLSNEPHNVRESVNSAVLFAGSAP
jgi:hypothetical protein